MSKRKSKLCSACQLPVTGKFAKIMRQLHPDFPPPLHKECTLYLILSKRIRYVPRAAT